MLPIFFEMLAANETLAVVEMPLRQCLATLDRIRELVPYRFKNCFKVIRLCCRY